MNNLLLTGKVGVGKSTILKEVLEKLNLSMGGYVTERSVKNHIKTFTIRSLYNGIEKHNIAKINTIDYSKKIFINTFETVILSILDKSLEGRDLIVLDELGFMENDIDTFTSKVYELLDSEKIVFGVLKDFDCQFLNAIRSREDVIIVKNKEENRNTILDEIIEILKSFGAIFKNRTSFQWSQKRIELYNKALEHPSCSYPYTFIKEIKEYTGNLKDKNILDIGAGTGAFAIPFMKEGAYITAVDSSFNMIDSLISRANLHNLENINCIIAPFHRFNPAKHDIAISAFSGGSTKTPESIKKMHNLVNEYSFIISSFENQEDNFKTDILYEMLGRPPRKRRTHSNTLADTLKILDDLNYKYDYKKIEYEFSQYFHNFNEALDFFTDRINIAENRENKIIRKFLNEFLIKKDDQYIFENIKKSWLITIKSSFDE